VEPRRAREAFENYQRLALEAGTSGSWDAWSEQFTEDATYIEHLYGTMGGREAIRKWISTTMSQPVNCEMKYFPIEWYVIDEDRGWVIAQVWNRMVDPGRRQPPPGLQLHAAQVRGQPEVVLRRGHLQPGALQGHDHRVDGPQEESPKGDQRTLRPNIFLTTVGRRSGQRSLAQQREGSFQPLVHGMQGWHRELSKARAPAPSAAMVSPAGAARPVSPQNHRYPATVCSAIESQSKAASSHGDTCAPRDHSIARASTSGVRSPV
jgi:hypothetical protein